MGDIAQLLLWSPHPTPIMLETGFRIKAAISYKVICDVGLCVYVSFWKYPKEYIFIHFFF